MNKKYPISAYDKNVCLKMDMTMWFILLFLNRPFVIMVVSLANRKDRMGMINMMYADRMLLALGALAAIPAALLIYAWVKRLPGAADNIRRIWSKGRLLLAVSALLNAILATLPYAFGHVPSMTISLWAQFGISLLVLYTIYTDGYIKDVFEDFPD